MAETHEQIPIEAVLAAASKLTMLANGRADVARLALAAAWPFIGQATGVAPDAALGRCQVMLQCHRETGHEELGLDHEAREAVK